MFERKFAMKPNFIFILYYPKMRKNSFQHHIRKIIFLIFSFPHLFCSSVIIETLMNIINILSYSLNEDNLHKVTAHHRVPDTNYTIQFVDTHEKRLVSWKFSLVKKRFAKFYRNFLMHLWILVELLLNKH